MQSTDSTLTDYNNFDTVVSTGNVITNDDGDGQTMTVTTVNGIGVGGSTTIEGNYGNLVIDASGEYVYTPTKDASGIDQTDEFEYTVSDANGNTDTATLSIAINSDGQAPALVTAPISTNTFTIAIDDTIELPDTLLTLSDEGLDVLSFEGADQVISLADLMQPETLDIIDISGLGANTLNVAAEDISSTLYIKGDSDDTVDLGGAGDDLSDTDGASNPSSWIDTGVDVTDTGGQAYNVWQLDNDISTQIYIDTNITNVI